MKVFTKKQIISLLIALAILLNFALFIDFTSKVYAQGTYTVGISATDIDYGEVIEGATLQIIDSNENIITEWVSTTETHKVTGLNSGEEYTLKATVAPEGYTIPTNATFTIASNGTITSTGSITIDETSNTVLLAEFAKTYVEILGVKESDESSLSDVTVQIIDNEENVIEEWSTASNQNHIVSGLITEKTYTVRVTSIPTGFEIPSDFTFTISPTGAVNVNAPGTKNGAGVVLVKIDEIATNYDLWVGNTRVTSANAVDVLNDGKVSYNATTNTLTLNGATITGGGDENVGYGIRYIGDTDLNIIANGTNVVSDTGTRVNGSAGLLLGGDIGDWSSPDRNHNSSVNITVNSGSSLTFNGGTVSGYAYGTGDGIGMWQDGGNITISGSGDFKANAGSAPYSYGLFSANNVTINSTGNVNISGANDTSNSVIYSSGIEGRNITITNGTINASGGNATVQSYGITTNGASYYGDEYGNIAISGGIITATSGSVPYTGSSSTWNQSKSYGIFCDRDFTINGGTVIAKTTATEADVSMAINKTPILASGIIAAANTESNPTDLEIYNPDNNDSYKFFMVPVNTHTVTFETYGGGTIGNQIVISGQKAIQPIKSPTKNGFNFNGWFTDNTYNTPFDFNTNITQDTTIHAKWKKINDNKFTDVSDQNWFYNGVKYVYENNIMKGLSSTIFGPNEKLTRGMMVTILYRMEGEEKISGEPNFLDVKDSSKYYYKAVKWASDKKIVSGYSNGKFGPADNITRQDLAVILYKYAKFKGKSVNATDDLKGFANSEKISNYAITQVRWAVGAGVITGSIDKNTRKKYINPKGNATRAEVAAMLQKYCTKVGR